MKKIIVAVLACMPLFSMAQSNVWEIPEEQNQEQTKKEVVVKKEKEDKPQEDPKYLAGAVPLVNGEVVFTLDKNVPDMSAEQIYDKVYPVISNIVKESKSNDLTPGSRIAAVNKGEHTIVATMDEWLVFSSNFISLDRTEFNYIIVAKATDNHINVTIQRIRYAYEMNRGNNGLAVKAEEWITDKEAINKKGTKLRRANGKFRRKTIDRKDNIFSRISNALGIK